MFRSENNQNGESSSFSSKVKEVWNSFPFIVKSLVSLTLIFYLLSWIPFFAAGLKYLVNIPYFTIFGFRIWTLITTILITPSILNIVFAFMSWVPGAIPLEKESGSTRYLLNVLIRSTIIQVLYVLVSLLLAMIFGKGAMNLPSTGLWPLIIADITIFCITNPDREMMFFFVPYPIKAKYYPWVLLGFFTILNFNIQFDLFCGCGFGYLFVYKLKDWLELSQETIVKVESSSLLSYIVTSESYVKVPNQGSGNIGNIGGFSSSNNNQNQAPKNETYETKNSSSKPTTAFQGKGVALGGSGTNKIPGTDVEVLDVGSNNETLDIQTNKTEGGYHNLISDSR